MAGYVSRFGIRRQQMSLNEAIPTTINKHMFAYEIDIGFLSSLLVACKRFLSKASHHRHLKQSLNKPVSPLRATHAAQVLPRCDQLKA